MLPTLQDLDRYKRYGQLYLVGTAAALLYIAWRVSQNAPRRRSR